MFLPTEHKIKQGDTLSEIAQMYNTNVEYLAKLNNIKDINKIRAGKTLKLFDFKKGSPTPMTGRPFGENPKLLEFFSGLNPFADNKPTTTKEKSKQTDKKKSRETKKIDSDSLLPINIRQFFNPEQDRTEADLSTAEKTALKEVIAYSQSPERVAEKIATGINPNVIEYKDYETTAQGAQYADVGGPMGLFGLAKKIQDPRYNLKTFLGQATAMPQDDGSYKVVDKFDFKPKTQAKGLQKFVQYLSSIDDAGINPYAQLRNYMGYYGPQEGTGQGGVSNIQLAQGGQTHNFNQGGSMNEVQKQVKNIASKGRYGDSMLMHVNPMEVNAIAQQVPLTINPETGQPEAFLPFLAPVLGSMAGGALLGGTALGTLGASALGSGLAQYAVTGDLKKGLLAGLTGYGIGTALQGAGAAAQGAQATQAATDAATTLGTDAATQVALADPSLLKTGVQLSPDEISGIIAGGGPPAELLNTAGLDQVALQSGQTVNALQPTINQAGTSGFGNVMGSADYLATDPTPFQAGKDAFSGGFKEGVGNLTTGLMQPGAYIPAGIGMGGTAVMESQELFEEQLAEAERARREGRAEMYRNTPEPILYSAAGGLTQFQEGGSIRSAEEGDYTELPQIFAPDRTPYQVNPDFMPGFSPETMYFNPSTISAPASNLSPAGFGPPMITDTYAGSKGGFGGRQASIAPQTAIDPFQAYTGTAPEGLQFNEAPIPMAMNTGKGFMGKSFSMPADPFVESNLVSGGSGLMGKLANQVRAQLPKVAEQLSKDDFRAQYVKDNPEPPRGGKAVGAKRRAAYESDFNEAYDDYTDLTTGSPQIVESAPIQYSNMPGTMPVGGFAPEQEFISQPAAPIMPLATEYNLADLSGMDFSNIYPSNYSGGGDLKPIPADNKGLPKLPESVRNEMGYMQEGGDTEIDPLITEVTKFILGESDNNEALNSYIAKYGNEEFMKLRQQVLESIVPGAQTEGLIEGMGNGGMDDDLRGMIGNKEKIAVSQDEFIVPADVVSMLGDGSSDAGSKKLYEMMDRVRKDKTGTTQQADKIKEQNILPA